MPGFPPDLSDVEVAKLESEVSPLARWMGIFHSLTRATHRNLFFSYSSIPSYVNIRKDVFANEFRYCLNVIPVIGVDSYMLFLLSFAPSHPRVIERGCRPDGPPVGPEPDSGSRVGGGTLALEGAKGRNGGGALCSRRSRTLDLCGS